MSKTDYHIEIETMADALAQKKSYLYAGMKRLLENWCEQTSSIEEEYIIPLCTIVHDHFADGSKTMHDVFIIPGSESIHFASYPSYLSVADSFRDYYVLTPDRTGRDSISTSNLRKVIDAFPSAMQKLRELLSSDIDNALSASDKLNKILAKF